MIRAEERFQNRMKAREYFFLERGGVGVAECGLPHQLRMDRGRGDQNKGVSVVRLRIRTSLPAGLAGEVR